jgi:hypothetical protein
MRRARFREATGIHMMSNDLSIDKWLPSWPRNRVHNTFLHLGTSPVHKKSLHLNCCNPSAIPVRVTTPLGPKPGPSAPTPVQLDPKPCTQQSHSHTCRKEAQAPHRIITREMPPGTWPPPRRNCAIHCCPDKGGTAISATCGQRPRRSDHVWRESAAGLPI